MSARITEHEAPWLELVRRPGGQAQMIELLREHGCPEQQALGLPSWCVVQAFRLPDRTSSSTRSQYRKILARLNAAGVAPPPANGRRRRESVGSAQLTLLSGSAAAIGMTVAASGHPAGVVGLVPLYITNNRADCADQELLAA